jgi:glutamate carboxypeptidase
MRLNSEDRAVLDHIARDGGQIVDRAVDWCAVNSGSRHLAGLERQRQILLDAARACPPRRSRSRCRPRARVAPMGARPSSHHPPSLAVVVRPEAPVQVVLTGHYDTVYPETSPFQVVRTRPDGALHGPASPT